MCMLHRTGIFCWVRLAPANCRVPVNRVLVFVGVVPVVCFACVCFFLGWGAGGGHDPCVSALEVYRLGEQGRKSMSIRVLFVSVPLHPCYTLVPSVVHPPRRSMALSAFIACHSGTYFFNSWLCIVLFDLRCESREFGTASTLAAAGAVGGACWCGSPAVFPKFIVGCCRLSPDASRRAYLYIILLWVLLKITVSIACRCERFGLHRCER